MAVRNPITSTNNHSSGCRGIRSSTEIRALWRLQSYHLIRGEVHAVRTIVQIWMSRFVSNVPQAAIESATRGLEVAADGGTIIHRPQFARDGFMNADGLALIRCQQRDHESLRDHAHPRPDR